MTDKQQNQPRDARPTYEPPRALRLIDTHPGAGPPAVCSSDGSGDAICSTDGNGADECLSLGNGARPD